MHLMGSIQKTMVGMLAVAFQMANSNFKHYFCGAYIVKNDFAVNTMKQGT